jgi:hypothetical protein
MSILHITAIKWHQRYYINLYIFNHVKTEICFDEQFWISQDLIMGALDNVPARLYIDKMCIFYEKPLLEAGTNGKLGNTEVSLLK